MGFDEVYLGSGYRCPFIVTVAYLQIENKNPPVFEQVCNKQENSTPAFYPKIVQMTENIMLWLNFILGQKC